MLKTCLLVTDDPDDHQAFSEALSRISERTIVLIVLDSEKAMDLLTSKRHAPDYIFLDLSMHGIRINTFLKTLKSEPDLQSIPTVVYGDIISYNRIEDRTDLTFFNKEYEYSELRNFLSRFFETRQD